MVSLKWLFERLDKLLNGTNQRSTLKYFSSLRSSLWIHFSCVRKIFFIMERFIWSRHLLLWMDIWWPWGLLHTYHRSWDAHDAVTVVCWRGLPTDSHAWLWKGWETYVNLPWNDLHPLIFYQGSTRGTKHMKYGEASQDYIKTPREFESISQTWDILSTGDWQMKLGKKVKWSS